MRHLDQPLDKEQRFQKLIDLSVKGRYCPHTDLDWENHPSDDVPWMPFELCTLFHTETWQALTDQQRVRLSQLEMMNIFSVTLAGEQEIQKDLMPLLFTQNYRRESAYLSIFLREEYDHTAMFWKFCNTYRGDIYRTKKYRMHKWEDELQEHLNGFVQTLIAEETLTFFNHIIAINEETPNLIREINKKHKADESRHIVMGRQMVEELWARFRAERSPEIIAAYCDYIRKYIHFFLSSIANVDVYREAGIDKPFERKMEYEKYVSKNINKYAPAKRLLDFLTKIDLYQPIY